MTNTMKNIIIGILVFVTFVFFAKLAVTPSQPISVEKKPIVLEGIQKFYHDFESNHPNWNNNQAVRTKLTDTMVKEFITFVNKGGMEKDTFYLKDVSEEKNHKYLVQFQIGSSILSDSLYHLDVYTVLDEKLALSLVEGKGYIIKPRNLFNLTYAQAEVLTHSTYYSPIPSISAYSGLLHTYEKEGKPDLVLGCYLCEMEGSVCYNPQKHTNCK